MSNFQIINADVLDGLKQLESESVDCVFTSPPYWGLRDYGVEGQLGLEKTFQEYIEKLVNAFEEVKRVLKPEGTCWINLGDTYNSAHTVGTTDGKTGWKHGKISNNEQGGAGCDLLPEKNLCNIPARFSIAMQDKGWILRNVIIWHKPSCMPSSVKDRFTVDFEYLFFFVKQKKYYFEQQFEQSKYEDREKRAKYGWNGTQIKDGFRNELSSMNAEEFALRNLPEQRNMRAVWSINTEPYSEAHFACFPTKLVERGLNAGCPTQICNKCGKARMKQFSKEIVKTKAPDRKILKSMRTGNIVSVKENGFSDCGCSAGFHAGTVLDPFVGSGTTLFVAQELGLNGIGIELNPKYIPLMKKRLLGDENQTSLNKEKITETVKA